jgi:hypothetical protein
VGADRVVQAREHGVARPLAARDALEAAGIAVQERQALGVGEIAFVREIVRIAGEGVDRLDRGPQPRRQQPGGDGEVLVVLDRQGGAGNA